MGHVTHKVTATSHFTMTADKFCFEIKFVIKKELYSHSRGLMDGAEVGNLLTLNGSPVSISPG